jgi:hypothetical protein
MRIGLISLSGFRSDSFPDWVSEEAYCRHIYGARKFNDMTHEESQFLLKVDGDVVAVGAINFSRKLGIAYIHNVATVEKHRRQGYFSET